MDKVRYKVLIPIIALMFSCCISYAGGSVMEEPVPFKSTTCRTDFGSYAVSDGSDVAVITSFIQRQLPNLKGKNSQIRLTFSNSSPGGYHYTFLQVYYGVSVFSSEIVVNVSRKDQVYSIFDDSYDMSRWSVDMTAFDYHLVPAYQSYISQYFSSDVSATSQQFIAYNEKTSIPVLAYLITISDDQGHHREVLVARDRILYEHDACMHLAAPAPPDSLVTGMVFRPDPLTTAHVRYYAPYMGHDSAYQNYNDSDTYQLNVQREPKSFHADYTAGIFSLSNQYIQLQQLNGDPTPAVTSTTPTFNFTRSQLGFLDVMVYYHINVMRSYVHDLGFNMADVMVIADAHALSSDEDYFLQPNSIYYGTGGVPDCQDADVILHEYTHFLSWNANQSNGTGASAQRNSIDEGSADYNATSYSASMDTFAWYNMFTWDGHNEYWPGRLVNDATVYPSLPNAPGLNGIYKYSVIWSSALMQIWWDIGRGPADSIFYQSLYGLAANITLPDAAQQYIKADSLLFNGQYHCMIVRDFHQHGLAVDAACGVYPLGVESASDASDFVRYTSYPDGFKVEPLSSASVDVTIYDIAGQRLASYHDVTAEIRPDFLPAGIYIIDVASMGMHKGYKWPLVK